MAADEHDRQRFACLGEPALQLEAVQTGHRHIEHQATRSPWGRTGRGTPPRTRTSRRSNRLSRNTRESAFSTLVSSSTRKMVGAAARHSSRRSAGKLTQNVVPPPALFFAVMLPWCAATIDWQIASPMPMPPGLVL